MDAGARIAFRVDKIHPLEGPYTFLSEMALDLSAFPSMQTTHARVLLVFFFNGAIYYHKRFTGVCR